VYETGNGHPYDGTMPTGDHRTPDDQLARLVAHHEISEVIYRYCRGIDRRDFDLVRSCYHHDATDEHGVFRGSVDEFIDYVKVALSGYERTMHFIGNVLIDVEGSSGRAESHLTAYHRVPPRGTHPERDFIANLRYVDDFQHRGGEWRIATRVCVFEFSRLDPVNPGGWLPSADSYVGRFAPDDPVYAPSLADLRRPV
jgi:3-phenylpropionate/cinnamic acid dioxygenase small subunit